MKEERTHILEELKDTKVLKSLKKQDVFSAPEGYFDGFWERLKEELEGVEADRAVMEGGILSTLGAETGEVFTVPKGYFEQLSDSLGEEMEGLEEEDTLGSGGVLEGLKKSGVFKVPTGYFDKLEERLEDRQEIEEEDEEVMEDAPLLFGLKKKEVFAVPEGYFEGLEEKRERSLAFVAEANTWQTRFGAGIRYMMGAAAVVLMLVGGWWLLDAEEVLEDGYAFSKAEYAEVMDMEDVDPYLLAENMDSEQLAALEAEILDNDIPEDLLEEM